MECRTIARGAAARRRVVRSILIVRVRGEVSVRGSQLKETQLVRAIEGGGCEVGCGIAVWDLEEKVVRFSEAT
jgi:hypothetical protein